MKKLLITSLGVVALSAAAHAQTAPASAVSNILDGAAPGTITAGGITVYGTVDVGYVYQNHGANGGVTGSFYQGAPYVIQKFSDRSYSNYQNNANGISNVGIKGEQTLQQLSGLDGLQGWSAGFDLQVNFDPLYGQIADICKTLLSNAGKPLNLQTASGDGQRCGQLFGGDAYGYVKNDLLGKLGYGRQTSLLSDAINDADVNKGSYAFSLFGYSGTQGGGAGATEDGRWNNSLKYTNTIGFVRVGADYRFAGGGQGGDAWGLRAGIDVPFVKGLSLDYTYDKQYDSVVSSIPAGQCPVGIECLGGTYSNNEGFSVTSKYKINPFTLAGYNFNQLTIAGGFEEYRYANPSNNVAPQDLNTIGGYSIVSPTANAYTTNKVVDVYWVGGSYQITPKLVGNLAWYHYDQNSFISKGVSCQKTIGASLGVATAGNCSGSFNEYSIDYTYALAKRLDLYAGASYTDVSGGAASGFLATNNYNLVTGVRFKF